MCIYRVSRVVRVSNELPCFVRRGGQTRRNVSRLSRVKWAKKTNKHRWTFADAFIRYDRQIIFSIKLLLRTVLQRAARHAVFVKIKKCYKPTAARNGLAHECANKK